MRILITSGQRFGSLLVIEESPKRVLPSGQKIRVIKCLCDCGVYKNVILSHLIRGKIKSCGCVFKTKLGESNTKLHRKYKSMIERCMPNNKKHSIYYDRGIGVCKDWFEDFFVFKKWALENGYSPKLTIDRIDNYKGYSPDNCRFISARDNSNNRRNTYFVEYKGCKYPITELFDLKNIDSQHRHSIRCRILRGWDVELAFDTPIKVGNYVSNKNRKTQVGQS